MKDAKRADPTLETFAKRILERAIKEVRLPMVGRVISYDGETRRAKVHPCIPNVVEGEMAGEQLIESGAILPSVPVCFYSFGGFELVGPVLAGDVVALSFSRHAMTQWLESGRDGQDPGRVASDIDCYAMAGPLPMTTVAGRAATPTDHVRLGLVGVDYQFVALANLCNERFERLEGARYRYVTSTGTFLTSTALLGNALYNAAHPSANVPNPTVAPAEVNNGDAGPYTNGHFHVTGQALGDHALCDAINIGTVPAAPVGVGSATVKVSE